MSETNINLQVQKQELKFQEESKNQQPQAVTQKKALPDAEAKKAHADKRKKELLKDLVNKSSEEYRSGRRALLRTQIKEQNDERRNYLGGMTAEEEYASEYHTAYRETKSANKRQKAINNPKSRLFKKAQNKEAIKDAAEKREEIENSFMDTAKENQLLGDPKEVPEEEMEERREIVGAFSAFARKEGNKNNFAGMGELMTSFLGLDRDLRYLEGEQKEALKEKRQHEVMDKLTTEIITEDLSQISLYTDADIAANSQKFEQLKHKVEGYKILMRGSEGYFKSRGADVKKEVEEKLRKIKLICEYYDVRKEIIEDPHYATHYNSELTMQAGTVDQKQDPAKYELSKKLLKSYYLGLSLSNEHLGGIADMNEIAPFREESSRKIQESVKKEVDNITNSAKSISISYVSRKKETSQLKSGMRESTKKRWAHSHTTKEYGKNLKNIAERAKREGTGNTTEADKIVMKNQFEVIKEDENEDDED